MANGRIKNYFPGGNTPAGFYSFYQYLPYKTDQVFIIKGGPGTGKSTLMKKIGYLMQEKGYDLEFHWCSSDNDSLDGVVIPRLGTAIFDGTAPHLIDPLHPGAVDTIINLGDYWDSNYLREHRQEIISLNKRITHRFNQAYSFLKAAKQLHNQWKNYYSVGLQINKVNNKSRELTESLLADHPAPQPLSSCRHLFGSAITPEGAVNYYDNLTADMDRRYILQGEPGCGKSTLIKRVADNLSEKGFEIIYLHRPLEVEKLDALIIPDLKTAIVVDTPPHQLLTTKDGDVIIDMLKCVNIESIVPNTTEINEVKNIYQQLINKVYYYLMEAKKTHDLLEEFYINAMDFLAVENKRQEIAEKILS